MVPAFTKPCSISVLNECLCNNLSLWLRRVQWSSLLEHKRSLGAVCSVLLFVP
jgi:hypothetical protein